VELGCIGGTERVAREGFEQLMEAGISLSVTLTTGTYLKQPYPLLLLRSLRPLFLRAGLSVR